MSKGPYILASGYLLIIIIFLVASIIYRMRTSSCASKESPYCLTITCPCDTNSGPCKGYAKKQSSSGNWYCSSAPNTEVDSTGKPL